MGLRYRLQATISIAASQADLQEKGSFDTAVQGCSCVIHTATPVMMDVPPDQGPVLLIEPAVAGVENVLASVERAPSVRRVVLTSSVGAHRAYPAPYTY